MKITKLIEEKLGFMSPAGSAKVPPISLSYIPDRLKKKEKIYKCKCHKN